MVHQDGFQVPQTFPLCQLRVYHYAELIPTGKGLDILVSVIFLDDSVEHILRNIAEELTEDVTALVHFADILLLDQNLSRKIKFQNHRGIFSLVKHINCQLFTSTNFVRLLDSSEINYSVGALIASNSEL